MSDMTHKTDKTPRTITIELPPGSRIEGLFDAVLKAHKQRLTDEAAAEEQEKAERMKAAAAGDTYHGPALRPRIARPTEDLTEEQIAKVLFERGTALTLHALTRPPTELVPHARAFGIAGEGDWFG